MRLPKLINSCAAFLLSVSCCLAQESASGMATLDSDDSGIATVASALESESSFVTPVVAQSTDPDLDARIRKLEAEIETLRNRPVVAPSDPLWQLDRRLESQDDGTGGLFGSVEVLFLRPHVSGAPSSFGLGPTVSRTIDSDYTANVRYVLGYMTDSGLGIRGRYWSFDDQYQYVPPFAPAELGIAAEAADLEAVLNQRLRHFDLEISGGLRYGKLQYSNPSATLLGVGQLTFEGIGPTLGIGAKRDLGVQGLSLFGNLRGSMLLGDVRNGALLPFMPATTFEEEIMMIGENQLGVSWKHDLGQHYQLELRTAWETQYWSSNTISDDVYGIGSNLALTGPSIAVELKY